MLRTTPACTTPLPNIHTAGPAECPLRSFPSCRHVTQTHQQCGSLYGELPVAWAGCHTLSTSCAVAVSAAARAQWGTTLLLHTHMPQTLLPRACCLPGSSLPRPSRSHTYNLPCTPFSIAGMYIVPSAMPPSITSTPALSCRPLHSSASAPCIRCHNLSAVKTAPGAGCAPHTRHLYWGCA
jgi:hypothetical protein